MHGQSIKLSGLTIWQRRRLALDGLSLTLEPGLLTALIGPPGAGKSTAIRALAGLIPAQSGSIAVDGRDLGRLAPHKRGFGVVLQPDLLFPHLTVAENVAFPLRVRRVRAAIADRQVADMLEMMQLSHAADLMPDAASPAERQRAMLARACVFAPPVLLLDEPFSAQDSQIRASLIASLRRVHDLLGGTTLLAMRAGAEALPIADRVAVLREGALLQYGDTGDVFDHPRNAHVAESLGEVNRLVGQVRHIEGDIALVRLACGPQIEALSGKKLQAGDLCTVVLRPDRIALALASAADMGEHALDATILEIAFEGESYRLRLLIGSGTELILRRPAAAGLRRLTRGESVAVAWQPQHAVAFRNS